MYFIYIFVMGALVFRFQTPSVSDYLENNPIERFWGEEEELGPDRVLLVESGEDAKFTRINIIENAEKTIDISYYSFHDGLSTDIFTASVLNAANRGVQVRIILDGIANFMRDDLRESIYLFTKHENIEFKYYEPINGLKPWTWNNRLHDKMIIVDNKWAIIGGRNIGDKYFDRSEEARISHDRDVLIMDTEGSAQSAVAEMSQYFDVLWNDSFANYPLKRLSSYQRRVAQERKQYLFELRMDTRQSRPEFYDISLDWMSESIGTSKITFIHNPLTRFNKEPWVWYEITRLMEAAEQSILIQSPYVIPNKMMQKYIDIDNLEDADITILTNSYASNPNELGLSGYLKFRKDIVNFVDRVYEYQGTGSLHAKSFIFDDRISMVGTFNTDPRSAFLSTESMVVIDSREFTEVLKESVDIIIEQSLLVQEDFSYVYSTNVEERPVARSKRIKIRIISALAYFFDYLL